MQHQTKFFKLIIDFKMTEYEFWALIISIFTALGTCGATILALYFGLSDKRIKLGFRAISADTYGYLKPVEGGYFVVNITNKNYLPIKLEIVGLKAYKKTCFKKYFAGFYIFENTQFDSLPKRLEFGESYVYAVPMTEIQKLIHGLQSTQAINELSIFINILTARRVIEYKLHQ